MLARPEAGTKADIKLWLSSQEQTARYIWGDPARCACALYSADRPGMLLWDIKTCPYPQTQTMAELDHLAGPATCKSFTFGELSETVQKRWAE